MNRTRTFLRDPRAWILAGATALGAGAWLGWDWLAAIGAAPIILAVLPCLGMCAAGLCVSHAVDRNTKPKPPGDAR